MKIARYASLGLAWGCVASAVAGFFLPWATLDVHDPGVAKMLRQATSEVGVLDKAARALGKITVEIRQGAETVTGELPTLADLPRQVSGVQIPRLANQPNAQVAMALVEILTNTRQRLGLKSYAVYAVPGLALLCGLLLTAGWRRRALLAGIAVVCAGVAAAGFWKLLTTDTDTLFVAVTIGRGLWMSLWAYVGLALAAVVAAVIGGRT